MTDMPPLFPTTAPAGDTLLTPPHFADKFSWRLGATCVWLLLLAGVALGLWRYGLSVSEHFLKEQSLENLWLEAFPVVMLAGPMAVIMLSGGLDLSVGSTAAFASVITASALANDQPPQDAFILAMLLSGGIGLLHALLIAVVSLNPIVLTLVTGILIQSGAVLYAAGQPIPLGQDVGFIETMHISPLVIGSAIAGALVLIQLAQLRGGGRGVPVDRQPWHRKALFVAIPYVLSGLAAGVVGCSLGGRFPMAAPNTDQQTAFMAILAALVGGNCTGRRFGTVAGAVAGAVILTTARHIMLTQAVDPAQKTLLIASAAGAAMLLSGLLFGLINLTYRRSILKKQTTA